MRFTVAEDVVLDLVSVVLGGCLCGLVMGTAFEILLTAFGCQDSPFANESLEDRWLPSSRILRICVLVAVGFAASLMVSVGVFFCLPWALDWTWERVGRNQPLTPFQQMVAQEFTFYGPGVACERIRTALTGLGVYKHTRFRFDSTVTGTPESDVVWQDIAASTADLKGWQLEWPFLDRERMIVDVWDSPAADDKWREFFARRGAYEVPSDEATMR